MSDGKFLYGPDLSRCIRTICAERAVDCAVAFWGQTIRDEFFPHWEKGKIRIVCDIAMGCNSQSTLKAYGAPENRHLKVHDGLHAKIYISERGAVVGSANASANGIGRSGREAGNLEAGVFFPVNSTGWRDAKALFEDLWKSPFIDEGQLNRAPERASDPGKKISRAGQADPSILARVKGDPDLFSSVLFIAEHENINPDEEKKLRKVYGEKERANDFEPKDRAFILNAKHIYYPCILPNAMLFEHDNEGKFEKISWYSDVVAVKSGTLTTIWGVKDWRKFRPFCSTNRLDRDLSPEDQKFIAHLDNGAWVHTAADLAHLLIERD